MKDKTILNLMIDEIDSYDVCPSDVFPDKTLLKIGYPIDFWGTLQCSKDTENCQDCWQETIKRLRELE